MWRFGLIGGPSFDAGGCAAGNFFWDPAFKNDTEAIHIWHATRMKFKLAATAIVGILIIGIGATVWSLSAVDHLATTKRAKTFTVDCEYGKFRQIMVRKNATAAIVGQSKMKLLEERIQDIEIDTSNDDRPLLNALRGRSESNVAAVKEITVSLDDPSLNAEKLVLRQQADIEPERMHVVTSSKEAAGNLKRYSTTLEARPKGDSTEVTLTVEMDIVVRVPKLFVSRADSGVQKAAEEAINEQASSIKALIAEHADERLILPELGPSGQNEEVER